MNEIERAIDEINNAIGADCLLEYPSDGALNIALEALKEKLEREKGCEYCKDYKDNLMIYCNIDNSFIPHRPNFCPICGRKLEVERDG